MIGHTQKCCILMSCHPHFILPLNLSSEFCPFFPFLLFVLLSLLSLLFPSYFFMVRPQECRRVYSIMSKNPIFQRQKLLEKKEKLAKSTPSTPEKRRKVVAEERKKEKKTLPQKDPDVNYVKKAPATPMLDTASMDHPFFPSSSFLKNKWTKVG
jgi:hypothetical protein